MKSSKAYRQMATVHQPVSYTHLDVYKRQGNTFDRIIGTIWIEVLVHGWITINIHLSLIHI